MVDISRALDGLVGVVRNVPKVLDGLGTAARRVDDMDVAMLERFPEKWETVRVIFPGASFLDARRKAVEDSSRKYRYYLDAGRKTFISICVWAGVAGTINYISDIGEAVGNYLN